MPEPGSGSRQPCNVALQGPCPEGERCDPVSGMAGICVPRDLPPAGSPGYPTAGGCDCTHYVYETGHPCYTTCGGTAPATGGPQPCPAGQHWNPNRGCVPDRPGGGVIYQPRTILDRISRFYTQNFDDYLWSGQLGEGVPQPEGGLLDVLQNRLFQRLVGGYRGTAPWASPGETNVPYTLTRATAAPPPVLGLPGGSAAYGYVDPSWMHDLSERTVWDRAESPLLATISARGCPAGYRWAPNQGRCVPRKAPMDGLMPDGGGPRNPRPDRGDRGGPVPI